MYRNTLRLALVPLPLLAVLRCVLKILFIDSDTGFLDGAPLVPWAFAVLLVVFAALCIFGVLRTQDAGITAVRGNRVLECAGLLCAAAIFAVGVVGFISLTHPDTTVNILPRWLRAVCYVLSLFSGVVVFWLALASLSGANLTETAAIASLVPACWQAIYLVERYVSFRQVTTVSDNLLETLFWLSSLVFWLAHARCIAGAVPNRRRAVLFALLSCLFGVPTAVGQIAALCVFGTNTAGAPPVVCIAMLAVCFYQACFAFAAAASPSAEIKTAENE